MRSFSKAALLLIVVAVALPHSGSAQEPQGMPKLSADALLARQLLKKLESEIEIRDRSRAIGMSRSITCGKKIVTIPLIGEGKHIASITVWKSSISGITYLNTATLQGDSPGAKTKPVHLEDSILIGLKEKPRDELGLVTTKRNYAPLLECLDQD